MVAKILTQAVGAWNFFVLHSASAEGIVRIMATR